MELTDRLNALETVRQREHKAHLVPLTLPEMVALQTAIKQRLERLARRRKGEAAWLPADEDVWQHLLRAMEKFRDARRRSPFAARGGR